MVSQKAGNRLFLSFPRRRESSLSEIFWTPAFAGVTAWRTSYETIKFPVRSNWPPQRPAARLTSEFRLLHWALYFFPCAVRRVPCTLLLPCTLFVYSVFLGIVHHSFNILVFCLVKPDAAVHHEPTPLAHHINEPLYIVLHLLGGSCEE